MRLQLTAGPVVADFGLYSFQLLLLTNVSFYYSNMLSYVVVT